MIPPNSSKNRGRHGGDAAGCAAMSDVRADAHTVCEPHEPAMTVRPFVVALVAALSLPQSLSGDWDAVPNKSESMSQKTVQSIIGRLVTDEEYRREFLKQPLVIADVDAETRFAKRWPTSATRACDRRVRCR